MKTILPISVGAVLFLTGCGDGGGNSAQQTKTTGSSGNPLTAPVDYLGAVGNSKQKAVKTVDVASLNQTVQIFNASEGRYPKDLQELVTMKYLTKLPDPPYKQKIVYNAKTGQVSVVPE